MNFDTDHTAQWAEVAQTCRAEIYFCGTYLKERWYWAAHCPTGMLRDGTTDFIDEAGTLAKYAICDYVDATVGIPR